MFKSIKNKKNILTICILLVAIPAIVIAGGILFREKYYAWLSLWVAVLSCVPLFYCFERRKSSSGELVILAVLVSLSAIGRFVFAWLPGFKPVTAITVIAAVWLGKEAGFVVGSLSAIVSNMYFGQGPWTPFQMFAWGIIGFLSGISKKPLQKSKLFLCVYGAFAGILYSALMDVWTAIWTAGSFNIGRYMAAIISSLPVTAEYAVSNIVFLLLLAKPIGDKLERIKKKYGLFVTG